MGTLTVVNRNTEMAEGIIRVNIMRGTALGNPFPLSKKMDRKRSIGFYRKWLWERIQRNDAVVMAALYNIKDLVQAGKHVELECCCKPKACHGDVTKAAIEWLMGGVS